MELLADPSEERELTWCLVVSVYLWKGDGWGSSPLGTCGPRAGAQRCNDAACSLWHGTQDLLLRMYGILLRTPYRVCIWGILSSFVFPPCCIMNVQSSRQFLGEGAKKRQSTGLVESCQIPPREQSPGSLAKLPDGLFVHSKRPEHSGAKQGVVRRRVPRQLHSS